MRMARLILAFIFLALPLRADQVVAGTTLQEITRDAQERLRQWDEEDSREQALESRYWWVGLIEMALSLTFGRFAFSGTGISFTETGGLNAHSTPHSGTSTPASAPAQLPNAD